MKRPSVIKMSSLTKVFYADEIETHALSEVNLTIDAGDYVSIEGPSGCGKSTLLSIIGLLDVATSGSYELNGNPVGDLTAFELARIGDGETTFARREAARRELVSEHLDQPRRRGRTRWR